MKSTATHLQEVLILEPRVFNDARGFFVESFNQRTFESVTGLNVKFVQDNHSHSIKGVLRGLHYQLSPCAQGKLVRCVHGAVFDVAVDIRIGSPTFGQWAGVELSAKNQRQFWIPAGFAHGFLTLTETADFLYKTTEYYSPAHERCIAWNDDAIGITWPDLGVLPSLASKDAEAPLLSQAQLS